MGVPFPQINESNKIISLLNRKVLNDKLRDYKKSSNSLKNQIGELKEKNIPYYPGCVTPTEIMQALELGITTVKFFPANIYGGLKALKALSGPFPQVKFIPTGGVDRNNIDEFLAFDKVAAIGGSFFVKEALEKMEA